MTNLNVDIGEEILLDKVKVKAGLLRLTLKDYITQLLEKETKDIRLIDSKKKE